MFFWGGSLLFIQIYKQLINEVVILNTDTRKYIYLFPFDVDLVVGTTTGSHFEIYGGAAAPLVEAKPKYISIIMCQ